MEEEGEHRRWDELIPDALGLIFRNLSLQEILNVVPRVCKSWGKAVSGPYCWQEIDIEEWSNGCPPDHIGRMLQTLITRSNGSLRKISVSRLQNDTFSFLAEHAGFLQTLRLPRGEISDQIVEELAGRISTITVLDVSYCNKIGFRALEAIGKHCKLLAVLCRKMHPSGIQDDLSQDDEAQAIANTMPRLKRLEMAYNLNSTESVLKILSSCRELEFMDLRGCWNVNLDDNFLKEKFPKLNVIGPHVKDCYVINDWDDDCSEYSDASEYLAWEFIAAEMEYYDDDDESYDEMWDDEQRLEELEFRFYEGIEDAGLYGWPSSP